MLQHGLATDQSRLLLSQNFFFAFYFGLFTSKEITLVRYAKVQYYFQIPYKLGEMPPYFEVKKCKVAGNGGAWKLDVTLWHETRNQS